MNEYEIETLRLAVISKKKVFWLDGEGGQWQIVLIGPGGVTLEGGRPMSLADASLKEFLQEIA